jgi:hypothetical protein
MPSVLTNRLNLPETIVKAVKYDTHRVAGDISVSQIIESPRVIRLKRTNHYEEDVSERLYMLMGTALHHVIERGNMDGVYRRAFELVSDKLDRTIPEVKDEEKRSAMDRVSSYIKKATKFFFPTDNDRYLVEHTMRVDIGDTVLYGTFDMYDKKEETLYDYKFCSTYMYTFREARQKWEAQTNVYAYMLEALGFPVKRIVVVAFFRDWSGTAMRRSVDYPPSQIMEIDVKKVPTTEMANYIGRRVELHKKAEDTGELPFCTGKERWAKADQWAVKTKGTKRALRVFASKEEAEMFMLQNAPMYSGMFLEFRAGESTRCERFCPVKDFCDQYKSEREERRRNSDDN